MAFNNFSTENLVVTLFVNGVPRDITDWGETDPPFDASYPDGLGVMRKGLGGGAARLDKKEAGQVFTLNLQPGSPDSNAVQNAINSKATIGLSFVQLGTLEGGVGTEGMVTNREGKGRGGQTITDDIYTIECNKYTETSGGE